MHRRGKLAHLLTDPPMATRLYIPYPLNSQICLVSSIKCWISAKRNFVKTLTTSLIESTLVDKVGARSVGFDRPPRQNSPYSSFDSTLSKSIDCGGNFEMLGVYQYFTNRDPSTQRTFHCHRTNHNSGISLEVVEEWNLRPRRMLLTLLLTFS